VVKDQLVAIPPQYFLAGELDGKITALREDYFLDSQQLMGSQGLCSILLSLAAHISSGFLAYGTRCKDIC
jgi:hypothetical protein